MTYPAGQNPYAPLAAYPQTQSVDAQQTPFNVAPPPQDEVEIKDFTLKEKRIKFKIDDDIFEASRIMGIPMMQDLVKVTKNLGDMSESGDYSAIPKIFDELLLPESAQRFRERLGAKGDDAIDVKAQLMPILFYILEKFGLRPTQLSSDSSTGSPAEPDGITSTAGSSAAVSTSEISTSPSS